jgi:hypothetical protein
MKLWGEVRWAYLRMSSEERAKNVASLPGGEDLLILCSRRSASTERGLGWS